MSGLRDSYPASPVATLPQLRETQDAFDGVAADYGSRLIDIGCGTGLDAIRMARLGRQVTATDWSPQMVERTRRRAGSEGLTARVQAIRVGAQELPRLAPPPYLTWIRENTHAGTSGCGASTGESAVGP